MLINIGIPGLLVATSLAGTGFNPVPLLLFSAYMAGTEALGMH
ncbi:hypothetical protein DEA8626_00846 [Defluviimonas aquaemixtae]|uniref:Uncharacterized protein n=1 Tax=Albidovulum aquaemixtae TaxID=1542388 RepID=A0A2R8B3Y4_9RHOB|nr:hypothetical protein DEA8626_00846 [Defluviimonas aquaemixtae]